jgi:hypothetical protein
VSADEDLDDLGIERRPAPGYALDRIDELGDVPHPVLEQVADARGVLTHQLEHVGRLEVLRKDQHRDIRVRTPDLRRRNEPVVRVVRRHPHVDDRDVGAVGTNLEQEIVGVARAANYLVSCLFEQ